MYMYIKKEERKRDKKRQEGERGEREEYIYTCDYVSITFSNIFTFNCDINHWEEERGRERGEGETKYKLI